MQSNTGIILDLSNNFEKWENDRKNEPSFWQNEIIFISPVSIIGYSAITYGCSCIAFSVWWIVMDYWFDFCNKNTIDLLRHFVWRIGMKLSFPACCKNNFFNIASSSVLLRT